MGEVVLTTWHGVQVPSGEYSENVKSSMRQMRAAIIEKGISPEDFPEETLLKFYASFIQQIQASSDTISPFDRYSYLAVGPLCVGYGGDKSTTNLFFTQYGFDRYLSVLDYDYSRVLRVRPYTVSFDITPLDNSSKSISDGLQFSTGLWGDFSIKSNSSKQVYQPFGPFYTKTGTRGVIVDAYNNGCTIGNDRTCTTGGLVNRHILLNNIPPLNTADSWYWDFGVTFVNNSTYQALANTLSDQHRMPWLGFRGNSISMDLSSNGRSFDIASGATSSRAFVDGEHYLLRYGFNGTEYYVDVKSSEDADYVREVTVSSTTKSASLDRFCLLQQENGKYSFPSTLHLDETRLVVDNVEFWSYVPATETYVDSVYDGLFDPGYVDSGSATTLTLANNLSAEGTNSLFLHGPSDEPTVPGTNQDLIPLDIPAHDLYTYTSTPAGSSSILSHGNSYSGSGLVSVKSSSIYTDLVCEMTPKSDESWKIRTRVCFNGFSDGRLLSINKTGRSFVVGVKNGQFLFWSSSNGTSWDTLSGSSWNTPIKPLVWYDVEIEKYGTLLKASYKRLDSSEWLSSFISTDYTQFVVPTGESSVVSLGVHTDYFADEQFDLSGTFVEINGSKLWSLPFGSWSLQA